MTAEIIGICDKAFRICHILSMHLFKWNIHDLIKQFDGNKDFKTAKDILRIFVLSLRIGKYGLSLHNLDKNSIESI